MSKEKINRISNKLDNIVREIAIYVIAITVFPFQTIRVLLWKWLFWIQKGEKDIKKFHKKINKFK